MPADQTDIPPLMNGHSDQLHLACIIRLQIDVNTSHISCRRRCCCFQNSSDSSIVLSYNSCFALASDCGTNPIQDMPAGAKTVCRSSVLGHLCDRPATTRSRTARHKDRWQGISRCCTSCTESNLRIRSLISKDTQSNFSYSVLPKGDQTMVSYVTLQVDRLHGYRS